MCLLLFAYRVHPQYPLLLAANRDEFHQRPTEAAAPWPQTAMVAGKDLEAGGTWAGVAPGRVAAVTNIREPQMPDPASPRSRGDIPRDFLLGDSTPSAFADSLPAQRFRGFNALLFDFRRSELMCAGNRHQPFAFTPGVHGISNGAPDAPWPKVRKGSAKLAALVRAIDGTVTPGNFVDPALDLLRDDALAPRSELPMTGVPPALERALSPLFVHIPANSHAAMPTGPYGTRASTLVAVDQNGGIQFWEQAYTANRQPGPMRHFTLDAP